MHSKARKKDMDQARVEGIVFTPSGEPLFARDLPRWREILATPAERTPAQIDEDEAATREERLDFERQIRERLA